MGDNSWRLMLGVQAVPSVIFILTTLGIPESPRWLILKRGKVEEARKILQTIDASEADKVVYNIQQNVYAASQSNFRNLFQSIYKRPVTLAILFAVFNQVSGINAIIYYAPRIFEMAGLGKDSALLSSAGIGFINLISTLLGLTLIDKFGRRNLMLVGSVGLILALSLVAHAFYTNDLGGMNVPIYLFLFIGFFGFSQGAVIWVFISEIFPNEVRAYGQALGSFTHWIMAVVISFSFPYISATFGGGLTFSFFALMMVLQLLFAWKMMPETKGTSLEKGQSVVLVH
jgi:sugar porter (SP) family MFS transporter